jgi:septal ring factor EnvC (AmiA/AmiB activator)
MNMPLYLPVMLLVALAVAPAPACAGDANRVTVFSNEGLESSAVKVQPSTQGKIDKIRKERLRLAAERKKMESRLGTLGKQLRSLDSALLEATKASRAARNKVRRADRKIRALQKQRKSLKTRVNALQQHLLAEALAEWRRTPHASQWLGIMSGASISDMPHRRYLLNALMRSQAQDRQAYIKSAQALAKVEGELKQQRNQLEALRLAKRAAVGEAKKRAAEKRDMTLRVRRNMDLKKQRDMQLAREERALLHLLESLSEDLLPTDQQSVAQHVRRRKGRLHWPLRGKLIGAFGSRLSPSRPALKGVQLKPVGGAMQVKAMAPGQVRYADWFGGFGLMTIVDYGDGVLGVYAHNDMLFKQLGDWVEEGEALAKAGSTGWVGDVVLYFEIRDAGKAVNPKLWCRR